MFAVDDVSTFFVVEFIYEFWTLDRRMPVLIVVALAINLSNR